MWDKGQESGRDGCIGAVAAYESLEPPATSDTLLYEGTHGWVVVVEAVDSLCPVGKLASRIGSVSPALSGLAALSPIAVTERGALNPMRDPCGAWDNDENEEWEDEDDDYDDEEDEEDEDDLFPDDDDDMDEDDDEDYDDDSDS